METAVETKKRWGKDVAKKLVGRTITEVRYMNAKETKAAGWYRSAIVLILDNGDYIMPMADDEGNDAGALNTSFTDLPVIPVI